MLLHLIRDTATASYCQGVLTAGDLALQTLELPWVPDAWGHGGKEGVSCVPPGIYDLVLHDTQHHPKSFALVNTDLDVYHEPGDVPADKRAFARTAILIHIANDPAELRGCIGVGMERSVGLISHSALAFAQFNIAVVWKPGHQLSITAAAWSN